jgi:Carboxypeptidase regulatory-like domain
MRIRLWLLLIMVSTLGAAAAQDSHTPTRLHGIVTDQNGGRITGAAVLVHPDPQLAKIPSDFEADIRLQTNQKGEFSVLLTPGLYDVVAFAHVFSPQCAKVRITEGGPDERNFILRLEPDLLKTID